MPTPQNTLFARWLIAARKEAKLTQEQVAERLDIAHPTYLYWEKHGRMWMEPEQLRRLATILRRPATEVAAAMGYPVTADRINGVSPPLPDDDTPPGIARRMAELDHRLAQLEARERGPAPRDTDEDIAS